MYQRAAFTCAFITCSGSQFVVLWSANIGQIPDIAFQDTKEKTEAGRCHTRSLRGAHKSGAPPPPTEGDHPSPSCNQCKVATCPNG